MRQSAAKDALKVERTILSCRTWEQAQCALQMVRNFERKWSNPVNFSNLFILATIRAEWLFYGKNPSLTLL